MLPHYSLNEFQWTSRKNINLIFYSRKAFGNIMCKTTSILSQHKCVRLLKSHMLCEHPTLSITKMNIDMLHPSMKTLTHLPLWQNGLHFTDDFFQMYFFEWKTSYNNNSLFSQELLMVFSLQIQQIWNIHHMYKLRKHYWVIVGKAARKDKTKQKSLRLSSWPPYFGYNFTEVCS